MQRKEMPIVVRLSRTELAQALGRPDDSSVQQLGGLTVVLRPVEAEQEPEPAPTDLIGAIGGPPMLRALAAAFRTVEHSLFRRLKADPALARRFVLDPGSTLAELGLAPPTCQAELSPSTALKSTEIAATGGRHSARASG